MALVICPECSRAVSDSATACPNCGYPMRQSVTDKFSNTSSNAVPNLPASSIGIKRIILRKYLVRFFFVLLGAWLIGCISTNTDPSKIYLLFKYPLAIFGIIMQGLGAIAATFIFTGLLIYFYGKFRKRQPSFWTYFLTACVASIFVLISGKV